MDEREQSAEPCPFCGSTDISDGEVLSGPARAINGSWASQSQCRGCGALGPEAKLGFGEVDYGSAKAVAAWNRRASLTKQQTEPGPTCPLCYAAPPCQHSYPIAPAYPAALAQQQADVPVAWPERMAWRADSPDAMKGYVNGWNEAISDCQRAVQRASPANRRELREALTEFIGIGVEEGWDSYPDNTNAKKWVTRARALLSQPDSPV